MKKEAAFLLTLYVGTAFSQGLAPNNNTSVKSTGAGTIQVFSPFWKVGAGWSSVVELHNDLKGNPLIVRPILLSPAGQRTELAMLKIQPLSNAAVDIGAAIGAQGLSTPLWGSAIFEYSSSSGGALLAETAVTQAAKTLAYTITSSEHGATSPEQHGVFWLPSDRSEVYIALQNTSAVPIHVTAAFEKPTGRLPFSSLTLAPNASQLLKAPGPSVGGGAGGDADLYGAIVLTDDGPSGALNTSGWIEDETTGFSTMMTFYDPAAHHGTTLFAPQVFVGKQDGLLASGASLTIDSYLVVLNVSGTPLIPQAQFVYESNGQISQVPIYIGPLAPGQSASIDIGDLQRRDVVPQTVSMGSITINYNGPQAALMGRVFGVADNPTYGFYVALESYAPARLNEAFWTTAGDWNSFITVANFGTQQDQITVEFTYDGGTITLPRMPLAPMQSVTLNARQLTAGRLPSTVMYGGMRISGSSLHTSQIVVKEHIIGENERMSTPFYNAPPWVTDFEIVDYYTNNIEWNLTMDFATTAQINAYAYWSDGEAGVDYDTPSSSDTSVVSLTRGDYIWSWYLNTQGVGNSTINWVSESYPYDIEGDQTTFLAQLQVFVRPTISWNSGQIISNTTQDVVIGQEIFLTGNPGNGSWSVSGVNVGGFETGATGGSLLVATSGTNVLFYWVTPGAQTATYTVNGLAVLVNFNVAGPANTGTAVTNIQNTTITPENPPRLALGFPGPGISFHSSATPPPGYNGNMQYVQIINSLTDVFGYPDGTHSTCTGSGLDTSYPYPFSNPPANTDTNDRPSLNLVSNVYSSESVSQSFTMYLMWQPSLQNAIFVPLGYVSWSWGGLATFDSGSGIWNLNNGNQGFNPYQATTTYPQWSQVYTGNYQCGPRQ